VTSTSIGAGAASAAGVADAAGAAGAAGAASEAGAAGAASEAEAAERRAANSRRGDASDDGRDAHGKSPLSTGASSAAGASSLARMPRPGLLPPSRAQAATFPLVAGASSGLPPRSRAQSATLRDMMLPALNSAASRHGTKRARHTPSIASTRPPALPRTGHVSGRSRGGGGPVDGPGGRGGDWNLDGEEGDGPGGGGGGGGRPGGDGGGGGEPSLSSDEDEEDDDECSDDDGDPQGGPARRPGGPKGVQLAYLNGIKEKSLKGPDAPPNVNFVRKLRSYTIHPPDPIIDVDSKPLNVAVWCLTTLFVCALFDVDSSFLPFCPRCNCTRYWHRGWSGFRRVVDVDRVCHAVTRRYQCKNESCGVEYLGWDRDILVRAPAHIRATFPVILTHRLAVTEAVFELMRSCLDQGTGPGQFTKIIQEHHYRLYDRRRLSYLARVSALRKSPQSGQTSLHASELSEEPPVFPAFDDPEGYGGIRVSARYLRSVYTFCMRALEGHIKRKNAKVSAKILSGDHFFKILRCNFTFGGSRSFEAAYSLVNEHSEIIAVVLTQSKSLEEIRAVLVGVAKRMVALGHGKDHITLFYTDNPSAEKSFLLSIFDGLHRGAPAPLPLSLISLPADHVVNLVVLHAEVNVYVRLLRSDLEDAVKAGKVPFIGMDSEWTVRGRGKHRRSAPTEVLQLTTAKRTLVIHLARTGMTHELKALLCDGAVTKVGRNIAVDVSRLQQQWPSLSVLNIKDVGSVGKELGLVRRANMSLVALCEQLLGVSLDKTEQLGHWGGDLSNAQVLYAAKDSYAAWALYEKMLSCGSRFIDPDHLTPNAPVIVMDASGTEAVAKATIAAVQPAPPTRRVAKTKKHVLVNVVKVLVPAFVLPVAQTADTTLGDLWHDAEIGGPRAAFQVPCRQLRDANHEMELASVQEQEERPRFSLDPSDGVFDAHAEVALDARRLQDLVSDGRARFWDDDEDGDSDWEDAPDDSVEDDADLSELEMEPADAADWAASGVKADPMHVMDRILRVMPKAHGALGLFSRRFSQSIMLSNLKDAMAAKAVAAKLWPDTRWPEILFRRARWLNKRVRRFIPAPDILVPRLKAVFAEFENIVDATTGSALFTPLALKASKAVLKLAECGAVSDDPGTPLYSLLAVDKDQLPLWLCSRGTNINEGAVHQKLVKNFLSMKRASPELVQFALLDWMHRSNVRAGGRNCAVRFPGHYDTWVVDALCKLEEELYGRRLSFPSWQCADDFSLPDFCCGVIPMEKSVLDKLGLPVGDILEKARTLLPRVSSQKRWLARALGSELPLLPVHTVEDIKLYHMVHKRLVEAEEERRKSAVPANEVAVITADCEPSIEELTVTINQTVTSRWMQAVESSGRVAPAVFFKTFDHVRMYQARFEKSRNMMSTLVAHGPALRRDVIATGESYVRFGPPVATMEAVHAAERGGASAGPVAVAPVRAGGAVAPAVGSGAVAPAGGGRANAPVVGGGADTPAGDGGAVAPVVGAAAVAPVGGAVAVAPTVGSGAVASVGGGGATAPVVVRGAVAPVGAGGAVTPVGAGGAVAPVDAGGAVALEGGGGVAAPVDGGGAVAAVGGWGGAAPVGCWSPAARVGGAGAAAPMGGGGDAAPVGGVGGAAPVGYWAAAAPVGDWGAAVPVGGGGATAPVGSGGAAAPVGGWGAVAPVGVGGAATPVGGWGVVARVGDRGAAPLLALGLPVHPDTGLGLRMGPPHAFLPNVAFAPAAGAAMTASSAVVPLASHSMTSRAASVGPAAASSSPSWPSSSHQSSERGGGPESAASAYLPVPKRVRAPRHCKNCERSSCPGRTHVSKCTRAHLSSVSGVRRAAGSSTVPPSSQSDGAGPA